MLIPLLPELGRILGPEPPVAELPAREAQARLHRVFRAFLRAVATKHEPLVLFLDDLQWTDGSTPQLLVQLLSDGDLRHVLVLGAYRDNEVGENHLLSAALRELAHRRPEGLHELRLAPLGEEALEHVVRRTLRTSGERARPLARLLFQKTGGNPFFTSELLQRLQRQGDIRFDRAARAFTYDEAALERVAFSDNVVDLMIERLRELPPDALELVKLAACLGNEFELALLARVAKKPRQAVASSLWQAIERRLLLPRGDEYRLLRGEHADEGSELGATVRYEFPHDRVLQAAYSLLEPGERVRVHLAIGRLLRDAIPPEEHAARVFEFVDHLNLGRSRLAPLEEREELASFNLLAAQRARRSAAYATAVAYLDASESALADEEWRKHPTRRFELSRMRVECRFLAGQVERASELCNELFEQALDRVAKASVFCLKAQIEEQQSRLGESVATILGGLCELGLELPQEPALVEKAIGEGIGKLLGHLERVPIEDLARLPVLSDAERIAQTELHFQLIPPASQM
ncbi:MAG TPA: AAA family ATPase, partial [Polyangiaceae bacterium]|nr:AAA family ATPase [Polyangiaceae bacterium]